MFPCWPGRDNQNIRRHCQFILFCDTSFTILFSYFRWNLCYRNYSPQSLYWKRRFCKIKGEKRDHWEILENVQDEHGCRVISFQSGEWCRVRNLCQISQIVFSMLEAFLRFMKRILLQMRLNWKFPRKSLKPQGRWKTDRNKIYGKWAARRPPNQNLNLNEWYCLIGKDCRSWSPPAFLRILFFLAWTNGWGYWWAHWLRDLCLSPTRRHHRDGSREHRDRAKFQPLPLGNRRFLSIHRLAMRALDRTWNPREVPFLSRDAAPRATRLQIQHRERCERPKNLSTK